MSKQKRLYKTRKTILEYYLKSAKTDISRMYFYGRLDELKKNPENGKGENMSIIDAKIEIVCDNCSTSIEFEPPYVYGNYSGGGGHYDTRDSLIQTFVEEEGWIWVNDGTQYCSEDCQEESRD